MVDLAIQLFTLRDVDEPFLDTVERVAETGYDGVEFAGLGGATPGDVAETLDETGLDAAGAHVGADEIEDDYGTVVDTYRTLGCERLVVPSYEREAFRTRDGAREAGRRLADLADRLAEDGLSLHYHNHTFEFTDLGDGTAFDVFAEAAEGVGIEVDTGLATHAGVDPLALVERYADRVELVHVTDCRTDDETTVHVELGAGDVDLPAVVDIAGEIGADWLVYEHGRTSEPLASMEHGYDVLAALLAGEEADYATDPRVTDS